MKIRLKPLRLQKRDAPIGQGGVKQDFVRVLVIAMLKDDQLYKAATVAATAWDVEKDRSLYLYHKRALYDWANSYGKKIAQTPDNIDPETRKKFKRQDSMWFGKTWKSHLSDRLWNRAVDVFDEVCWLQEEDNAKGISDAVYWWDEDLEQVVRSFPVVKSTKKNFSQLSPQMMNEGKKRKISKKKSRYWLSLFILTICIFSASYLFFPSPKPRLSLDKKLEHSLEIYETKTKAFSYPYRVKRGKTAYLTKRKPLSAFNAVPLADLQHHPPFRTPFWALKED